MRANMRTIIWAAMVGAVAVYLLLGMQLGGRMAFGELSRSPILPIAFGMVALGNAFAASFFWRRLRAADEERASRPEAASESHSSQLPRWIVVWALDESVGVFGLVLALLGYPLSIWVGFPLGAAVLLTLHR